MSSASPIDLTGELAENAAWLRRLARALVGEAAADDLVQDTMEVAIRRPPETDRPLRPWLRTVLRNAAKMHRRSNARREHREEAAPGPDRGVDPPDTSVARLETQRRVVQAVIALDEPYRQTVILRYVDDLSAAEIARQLDIPAGTVRSRLKRGLEMLRADFERQEDRPSWKLALAPLAALEHSSAAAAPVALGGFAMKAGIVAVALAAGIAAVVASTDSAPSPPSAALVADADAARARAPAPPPARVEGADSPSPGTLDPRRFRGPEDRKRFAEALARARRGAGERSTKTYDFSGVSVPRRASMRPRSELAGELDKDYIRERIAEVIPLVAECYDLARVDAPSLAGKLTVDFVIDAEEEVGGYVREATVPEESALQDHALAECVTETILSVEFAPPQGGGIVRVRYPFAFDQEAE